MEVVGFTCTEVYNPAITDWNTYHSSCSPICGDGLVLGDETCDDGSNDGIGCAYGCIGNATGWNCTGGGPTSASICKTICGDGILISPESCDDGNLINGDGCSSSCTIEKGWTCTYNPPTTSLCSPILGDGMCVGYEKCDNGAINDGCNANDTGAQPGYNCTACTSSMPSSCKVLCENI